jgi:hypothetical protein
MEHGSKEMQTALTSAHAELTAEELEAAFRTGRVCLSAEQFYETFAPYLSAKVDDKKKDAAFIKRKAIIEAFDGEHSFYYWDHDRRANEFPYDPRWLDLAVSLKRLDLVHVLSRPGHTAAREFAKAEFDAALKKAKTPVDVRDQTITLMKLQHPEATDAFFAAMAKRPKKATYYHYWYTSLVPRLPKEAIPRLEEMVAAMPDNEAKQWLDAIQELRAK